MSARSFLFFSLLFTAAAGCAVDPSDEPTADTESDLSSTRIQQLGTIASGATLNVHYTSTPYFYRAYSFTATKGDKIDASVTSANGEPVAYLLRSSFSTLQRNTGANIAATIPSTGTYYLAFREMEGDDADFKVTFTKTGSAPPPPPPVTTNDAFDPTSCTGAPLDFASKFAPGAAEAILADYQIVLRKRQCTSITGCSAWQSTTEHAGPSGHGKATLAVNPPRLVLVGDEASSAYGTPKIDLGTGCTLGNGNTTATCSNYYVTEITHGAWPYLVGPHDRHYRIGNSGVGSYHVDGDNVALAGTITNSCARLVAHPSKPDEIYPDAPYTDFEAAILIRY